MMKKKTLELKKTIEKDYLDKTHTKRKTRKIQNRRRQFGETKDAQSQEPIQRMEKFGVRPKTTNRN